MSFKCQRQYSLASKRSKLTKPLPYIAIGSLLALALVSNGNAFYLPGLAPVTYCNKPIEGSKCQTEIPLYVNRLNSEESVIPFEYNHFDFCQASPETRAPAENLGQVVFGERIKPSPYKLSFKGEDDVSI